MLRSLYPVPSDARVFFTEIGITPNGCPHKYYIRHTECSSICVNANTREPNGDFICPLHMRMCDTSVTAFIGTFGNKFDAVEISRGMARKQRLYGEAAEAYALDKRREWDGTRDYGHEMHALVEFFYNNQMTEPTALSHADAHKRYFEGFMHYHAETLRRGWRPFRTELRFYDEETRLPGSIDMIYVDREGRLILVDWKFSKNVKKEEFWGRFFRLMEPKVPDTTYWKYVLQLNMYRLIIQRNSTLRIHQMFIVAFHELLPVMYDEFVVPLCEEQVLQLFAQRMTDLAMLELPHDG